MNVVDDEFLPAHNRLKYQLSILKPYLHVRSCPTLLTKTVTLSALPDLPRWCHVFLYMMMIMDMMMMIMAMRRRATWQKGQMSSVRSKLDNGGTGALALVTSTLVVKMIMKIDFLCNAYLPDEKELQELKNQYLLLSRCFYSPQAHLRV